MSARLSFDAGTRFGPGVSVVDGGSTGTAGSHSGYSIVKAGDMDGARTFAESHPYLCEGEDNSAVDVYELMPVPLMD